jgi:hypothetical protein
MRKFIKKIIKVIIDNHKRYLAFISKYPSLLILLFGLYLLTSFLCAGIAFGIAITFHELKKINIENTEILFGLLFLLFLFINWSHFLYINIKTFITTFTVRGDVVRILRVVQLFISMTFMFGILFYYIQLFSDTPSFKNVPIIKVENNHLITTGPLLFDKILHIPDWAIVANLLYCSFCTISNLGYGQIYPISFAAKLVCSIEVLVGILLVVFSVGSLLGNKLNHKSVLKKRTYSDNRTIKNQCLKILNNGKRCRRLTQSVNQFCWQHLDKSNNNI